MTTNVMREEGRTRLEGAIATLLIHAAIGFALLWGLDAPLPRLVRDPLAVFEIAPPSPPQTETLRPPPRREDIADTRRVAPGREGAGSPPNLRSEATPVVAPPPIVPLPVPSPIVAAPVAGRGADPSSGAAEIRGPGTGAGGFGDGRGAGYGGDGGGGGGFGPRTPPRLLRGGIRDADYPRWAWEQGIGGTVGVRFTVAVDGRVVNCRITRSSGHAQLDGWTCELLQRRYRFAPSRDRAGRPVPADIVENHGWEVQDEPRDDDRDY